MNINVLAELIPENVLTQIPGTMEKYEINTALRLSHFLSQIGHESGNFRATIENLNYGAKGLRTTFGRYFPTDELAKQYERKPEKIANRVYANRMGNGPESSGDGWKYRGRGYIQLTGKTNYAAIDRVVEENILETPDLISSKYPLLSAGWFWNSRNINRVADRGTAHEVVKEVTRLINGGTNGLEDREAKFHKFYNLLT